ncbi:MAG TPA: YkvA family protein [Puia sp.]|jgi:uncharacterized membrane protein YkvA (DUF1232 family)|nr:YkvA family protein [Puia sp.]
MANSQKRSGRGIWILKKQLLVLYFGLKDSRTPFYAKIPAILSVVYLISPIDLIPDFIPFFGYLDDLIIVPLLLNLSIRLFPGPVREASQLKAVNEAKKFRNFILLSMLVFILAVVAAFFMGKMFYELLINRKL